MGFNMEFFNNKRLLIVLSGVACILIALVVFVVSIIGFGNIGAFFGGSPYVEPTPEPTIPTPAPTTPPAVSSPTPGITFTPEITTPPATETPEMTTPPATETPSESATEEPTPTVTPTPTIVPANSVRIDQGSSYTMAVGGTVQLTATVWPLGATNRDLIWTNVTGDDVAMVGATGNVRALSPGKATIKVQVDDAVGVESTIEIIVVAVTVEETQVSLTVGEEKQLQYTVVPNDQTATWESSDKNVVTVVGGKITAVAEGTATIKVSVNKVECVTIQVTVAAAPVEENPTDENPTETPTNPVEGSGEESQSLEEEP